MVIGSGRAFVEDDQLIIGVTFEPADLNPIAEKLFRKVLHGTIKAVSVGFDPVGEGAWGVGDEAAGKENQTYYFGGQELLEVSIVHIPANKNAVKRAMEALLDDEDGGTPGGSSTTEDETRQLDLSIVDAERNIAITEGEQTQFFDSINY